MRRPDSNLRYSLVVGKGEIGSAVGEFILPNDNVAYYDKNMNNSGRYPTHIDILHICFPYSNTFVDDVKSYIEKYDPDRIVVWSTVAIGTCKKIDSRVVHCPVEGKHPNLLKSIKMMQTWVGANIEEEGVFFREYFKALGKMVTVVDSTDYTEALKLLSTSEYGINIVFADYKKQIADSIGMDFNLMKQWNEDYNVLYRQLKLPQFQKYTLDPPNGYIGGHCVVPNAIILNEQFPSSLMEEIMRMA